AKITEATTYTWSVPDGAKIVSGQGTNTISVTWGSASGQVSVIPSNKCFTGTTRSIDVTVSSISIDRQPDNQIALDGCSPTVTFIASASGAPAPSIQWQVSTNGGTTWAAIAGKTSTNLTFAPTPSQNGNQYRAVFKNTCVTMNSNPATLTAVAVNTTTAVT